MLKGKLINPEILGVLGTAGHGSKVLIADGNYPFATGSPPNVKIVYLNLSPGIVSVPDVLKAIVSAVPIESAEVMMPASGIDAPIFKEFQSILPKDVELGKLERFKFYEVSRERDTVLVIATAEQRIYANILLTIGVIPPEK